MESNQDQVKSKLSKEQEKLIKNAGKNKHNIIGITTILIAICNVWIRYYPLFAQEKFFLIYNILFYTGFIWAVFSICSYEKKVNNLIKTFQEIIKEKNT
jgi:CDP-diglyceride synthetase